MTRCLSACAALCAAVIVSCTGCGAVTPVITVTPGESASDQELAELVWPKLIAFLRGAR